eukprot:Gb_28092 [translate_table: standard]
MATESERDTFDICGPLHLTHPDWTDPGHRRCIAAALVQGVYVLERDRQEKRRGPHALAEKWWNFFNFKLVETMEDKVDGSIFGAIYNCTEKHAENPPGVPKSVIALRGTITKRDTLVEDLKLDLVLVKNGLHKTWRHESALNALRKCIARHGRDGVWIAGHSLGASLALLAGRELCGGGFHIETHLFNPPFASAPLERIKNEKIKLGIHVAHSLVATGLAVAVKDNRTRAEANNAFLALRDWIPNLYVNPSDHICSGYVGYFGNRQRMHDMGAGRIANVSAQHSINDAILSALGKESKASHLIPSARLTVSLRPSVDFKRDHGIHQWWSPLLQFRCTHFTIPLP